MRSPRRAQEVARARFLQAEAARERRWAALEAARRRQDAEQAAAAAGLVSADPADARQLPLPLSPA